MAPERDLSQLLASIVPQRHEGVYVFYDVQAGWVPEGVEVQMRFEEDEATTVILPQEQAAAIGLDGELPSAWITLGASSDLAAVGFLAVVTARMAAAGISANVVSALHHDHLFVPVAMAEEAMAVLTTLEELHRPVQSAFAAEKAERGGIVEIRPARVEDAESLAALWDLCGLRFDGAQLLAELQSCIRMHGELVLVATAGASVVGSLWASYDGRRGWIQRLATDPARRGQGIASALMAEAEGRLAGLGAGKVNLLIEPDNVGVAAFYEKLGYQSDQLLFMERRLPPRSAPPRSAEADTPAARSSPRASRATSARTSTGSCAAYSRRPWQRSPEQ